MSSFINSVSSPTPVGSSALPDRGMDEERELGDLNERLASYIERQKERDLDKDNLEKSIHDIKSSMRETANQEISNLTTAHKVQLGKIRKNRDELSNDNAALTAMIHKLKGEQSRQGGLLKKISDTLSEKKKKCDSLEEENKRQSQNLKNEVFSRTQEVETLALDLTNSREKSAVFREEMVLMKQNLEKYYTDLTDLQMKYKILGEDKDLQKLEMQQQMDQYQSQIEKLENILGAKSLQELEDQLNAIRTRCNHEKEALRQELLLQYNTQSSEWQQKEESLQQMLKKIQKENQQLILESDELFPKASTHPKLETNIKSLNEMIEKQQTKIVVLKQRETDLQGLYTKERAGCLSAEEKFKGLYDINVNLTKQIKRYDYLLSHGEDHLHPNFSSDSLRKKRKCATTSLNGVTLHLAFDETVLNESHKVQGVITITNHDPETVSLRSWVLHAKETGKIFHFPNDAVLSLKQERTIYIGKKKNFSPGKQPDYHWDQEDIFQGDAGEAELRDATGAVIWSEKFTVTIDQDDSQP